MTAMRTREPKSLNFLFLSLFILFLDQLTKYLARHYLTSPFILIPDFLSLRFSVNTGAAFSILQGQNLLLAWFGVIVIGVLLYFYEDFPLNYRLPVQLLIIGIIGNTLDRFINGYVTDFIAFSFWPSFNIADSVINIAVFYIIILMIKEEISSRD